MTNPESGFWSGATCSGWSKRNSIHSLSKISWEEDEKNFNGRTGKRKDERAKSEPHYQLVTILWLLVKTGLGISGEVWVVHDLPQVREKASVGFERVLLEPQPKPPQVSLRSSRGGGRSLLGGLGVF